MHQAIVESLEEYIGGGLTPAAQRDFDAHLETCEECRREVSSMLDISGMFETLRPAEEILPSAGFCARVMQQVARPQVPSFWSLFSLDASFGRRVVFASLLTLAVFGTFLVSRETGYAPGPSTPEAVMAEHNTNRDAMLVTLSSYEP
jgi:anti-sigma factor RsiW